MEFGDVKIAIGIDLTLIQGMLNKFYHGGIIPAQITEGNINITLNQPLIRQYMEGPDSRLKLILEGSYAIGAGEKHDFAVEVRILTETRINGQGVPVAGFTRDGIIAVQPAELALFTGTLLGSRIDPILSALEIPVFEELIDLLRNATGRTEPALQWPVSFEVGAPSVLGRPNITFPPGRPAELYVDRVLELSCNPCLIATIALPGENSRLPANSSFVPKNTGLQIMISKACMNIFLAQNAASRVGTTMDGATIASFAMRMEDLGIYMAGRANKGEGAVNWNGIVPLFYQRYRIVSSRKHTSIKYSGHIEFFTGGVRVSVEVPWYVALFQGLFFFMGPIGWILNDLILEPELKDIEDAPRILRNAVSSQLSNAFNGMLSNLNFSENFSLFGHDAWIDSGNLAQTFIAFLGDNVHEIVDVQYDSFRSNDKVGRSVGLIELDSGHLLHPNIAGRLMKDGTLTVAGYHGVKAPYGYYVRSNPNSIREDNLLERF